MGKVVSMEVLNFNNLLARLSDPDRCRFGLDPLNKTRNMRNIPYNRYLVTEKLFHRIGALKLSSRRQH